MITPVFAPQLQELVQQQGVGIPAYMEAFDKIIATPIWQFYLIALFCATSLLGAVYMLKMKKIGFHIYAVSQIAQLAIAQFLMGGTTAVSVIISLLFIGLYAIYYKKFTDMSDESQKSEVESWKSKVESRKL